MRKYIVGTTRTDPNTMWGPLEGDRSGQSNVLGYALLFAIVLTVTMTVVVVGGNALDDARTAMQSESTGQSFSELQADSAHSGSTNGSSQEVSFAEADGGSGGGAAPPAARPQVDGSSASVDPAAGEIRINVSSNGTWANASRDLGTITYERDGQTFAYQGGAVLRQSPYDSGGVMVSPPAFEYQYEHGAPTLSLGITTLASSSTSRADGSLTLRKTASSQLFPNSSVTNPIRPGATIQITVESEYYEAWETLLDERTAVTPEVRDFDGDGTKGVRITLEGPTQRRSGDIGAIVTSDVTSMTYDNDARVTSYDSRSLSSVPPTYSSNAPVYVRGEFEPSNHVSIGGNVTVEDRAQFDPKNLPRPYVSGWVVTGGTSGAGEPTKVNGNTHFRSGFSTKDDLRIVGKNPSSNHRALFEGPIYVGGNVTRIQNARIEGDVHVHGDVTVNKHTTINGTVIADGNVTVSDPATANISAITDGSSADPNEPIDPEFPNMSSVSSQISFHEMALDNGSNDNPNSSYIDRIESPGGCDPSCTLTGSSGTSGYYVQSGIYLNEDEKLILNTTKGPIDIYAGPDDNGAVYVKGAEIEVRGDNPVRVYSGGNLELTDGDSGAVPRVKTMDATGVTRTYRAPNFQVYMHPSAEASLNGPPEFTGVIRGPHPTDGTEITFTNSAEIHGAIIGEIDEINEDTELHFDEALLDEPEVDVFTSGDGDEVSYLHVSVSEVQIDDE